MLTSRRAVVVSFLVATISIHLLVCPPIKNAYAEEPTAGASGSATTSEDDSGSATTSEDESGSATVSEDGWVVGHAAQTSTKIVGGRKEPLKLVPPPYSSDAPPPPASTPQERWELIRARIGECNLPDASPAELCPWDPGTSAPAATVSREAIEAIAREVVATLQLPPADPQIGPDPDWNEWKKAVIGHPLWLWTDGPRQMSSSNTDHGITVTLDARHRSSSFTMGDGTTRACANTLPYNRSAVEPGAPSPACGHTYQRLPSYGDTYPVTATTSWTVNWTAGGFSGTLPATMTASRDLPVTELQAVVIRHR